MDVSELEERLAGLAEQAEAEISEAKHQEEAIQLKNRYLGRKGAVQGLMGVLRDLPRADKPRAGQATNAAKRRIEGAYQARLGELERIDLERQIEAESVDVTLPARRVPVRGENPLRAVEKELLELFSQMGFEVARGPEIEEDFYNFEALNFPPDHPARDMQDTFVLKDGRLLRTHTSPVQVRTMLAYEPPISVVAPGRVYRCDSDVTHSPVFHQIEGLLVARGVTFANLKATLHAFVERYYGPETPVRFRPSYFPFTEPSAEVDIGCIFCGGAGCRVCGHTGWLEILGAGMVDPNVFEAAGIDPDVYTGFAFGLGVERIGMLKLGIDDIRLFYENDVRFLGQF